MRKHWDIFPNCPLIHIEIPRWMKIEKKEKHTEKKGCLKEILIWFTSNFCCCIPKFQTDFNSINATIDAYNAANGHFKKKEENLRKSGEKNYLLLLEYQ